MNGVTSWLKTVLLTLYRRSICRKWTMRSIKRKRRSPSVMISEAVTSIELEEKCIKLAAEDEYKLSAIIDMLRARMAKRDIPLRCLELGKVEPASKGTVRQTLTILQGIPKEKAKAIVAAIKATKLKVNAQMQDDQVRVSGAKKDDLQAVIQMLKAGDFGVDLQFINMR